jgi:hypothetical protein
LHRKHEGKASSLGHENSKKCKRVTPFAIIEFFFNVWSYESSNPLQLVFIEDLVISLQRGMCHYLQWNLLDYDIWSCNKMVKFISLLENNLSKTHSFCAC